MGDIKGLPPRRELSLAEQAERAERELAERLARDAIRDRKRRGQILRWMCFHAALFTAMHAWIAYSTPETESFLILLPGQEVTHTYSWGWLIGSPIVGALVSWTWWRVGDWWGGMIITAGGIGWILLAWMLGLCAPFSTFLALFSTPFVFGAHYMLGVFSSWAMSVLDRETM